MQDASGRLPKVPSEVRTGRAGDAEAGACGSAGSSCCVTRVQHAEGSKLASRQCDLKVLTVTQPRA